MRFSVLAEFFCGFAVLDDFLFGFAVSNTPQCPPQLGKQMFEGVIASAVEFYSSVIEFHENKT